MCVYTCITYINILLFAHKMLYFIFDLFVLNALKGAVVNARVLNLPIGL